MGLILHRPGECRRPLKTSGTPYFFVSFVCFCEVEPLFLGSWFDDWLIRFFNSSEISWQLKPNLRQGIEDFSFSLWSDHGLHLVENSL